MVPRLAEILVLFASWHIGTTFALDAVLELQSETGENDFSKISHERRLQENIFMIFRGDENEEEETSPLPTLAPSVEPGLRSMDNFLSCGTVEDGPPTNTATILFVYDVETNVEDFPNDVEQMILESLTTSLVNSIYETHCGRRLGQSSRKLRIESIAPGANDRFLENCASENNDSMSCKRYDGSLVVGFNDEGTQFTDSAAVSTAVLQIIAADMANDEYLLSLSDASGVGVTKVRYGGPQDQTNWASLSGYSYIVEESGLSTFGKAVIPILALMLLCMLGAVCSMQRPRVRKEKKKELATLVSEDGDMYLDRSDAESYVSADLDDLALCHSKMDVTRCNKTNCSCCHVLPSIQEVDIPPTNDLPDYEPSVEAHIGSLDSIFCTKPEVPKKRGMFGFGRSRAPPMIQGIGEVNLSEMETFEDEPQSVSFVKIDDVMLGAKRSFVDDSGYVRNEIEL